MTAAAAAVRFAAFVASAVAAAAAVLAAQDPAYPPGITQPTQEPTVAVLTFGDLAIDDSRREVRLAGRPLRLKPKEFDLLKFLARNRGIALSRDLILERVWGWTFDGNSRTVDVHVRWLREKIEDDPGDPRYIRTVRGVGYRLTAPDLK